MQDDQYLWDRSGPPDPTIVELERELSQYAAQPPRVTGRRPRFVRWAAIAAAMVLGIAAWRFTRPPELSPWQLDSGRTLGLGEKVTTGPGQHARLEASGVGTVRLDPNSALQVVRSGVADQRLSLTRGTLHALIWAPAKSFAVDTPAGTSIDLGCAYSLTVDGDGAGLVLVSAGWVAFQAGRTESFIPAGAACRTRRKSGPSLPYFTDASPAFADALLRWEHTGEVAALLGAARPRDALTVWHLLQRTQSTALRGQVARRFAVLVPQVDAAALERGDAAAINQAWNALGLGAAEWWRTWKHPWAG